MTEELKSAIRTIAEYDGWEYDGFDEFKKYIPMWEAKVVKKQEY